MTTVYQMLATFIAYAGPTYAWDGDVKGHRPTSLARTGLKAWMHTAQQGTCFDCGNALDATVNFCHIVSRGPNNRGWVPGNIALGHAACNANQAYAGEVVNLTTTKRADLIPMTWPGMPELTALGRSIRGH